MKNSKNKFLLAYFDSRFEMIQNGFRIAEILFCFWHFSFPSPPYLDETRGMPAEIHIYHSLVDEQELRSIENFFQIELRTFPV